VNGDPSEHIVILVDGRRYADRSEQVLKMLVAFAG
jgi:hypothetical protein